MANSLIVIGGGPAGLDAAMLAAQKGMTVTLFEPKHIGGTCLNEGCVPTKAMLTEADVYNTVAHSDTFGVQSSAPTYDIVRGVEFKDEIVKSQREGIEMSLRSLGVTVIMSAAHIVNANTVATEDGVEYSADYILIATGSSPRRLPIIGADAPSVITSTEMLHLQEVPKRLCIIGGGVIGVEFATMFSTFGSEVTIVEFTKYLLSNFDEDISKRIKQYVSKRGVNIHLQSSAKEIVYSPECTKVVFEEKGKEQVVECDLVLMSVGRAPSLSSLTLDNAGVEYSARGIVVDNNYCSSVPSIYAVGDVIGKVMLTGVAKMMARKAVYSMLNEHCDIDVSIFPSGVFCDPPVAMAGLTEQQCKAQELEYVVNKAMYGSNGRAATTAHPEGFVKLITDKDGIIIGIHIIGGDAEEIVHQVSHLMAMKCNVSRLRDMVFIHPVYSEVIQVAAHMHG